MALESAMRAVARGVMPIAAPLADVRLSAKLERYRLDPWAHCEDGHVRILDLETQQPTPFEPNQAQMESAEAWVDLDHLRKTAATGTPELRFRNVHNEKSRQYGETTGLSWTLLWILMYHEARGLVVSMTGDEVDDGGQASTYDSIFGKIRFMAEQGVTGEPDGEETFWPEHIRPGRYLTWRAQPSIIRNRLRPTSYLRGAVQSPDVGRSRKYTHMLLDEAARLAWGEAVQASVTRACPIGRFYNSTPFGKDNVYYRLREQRPRNYTFLTHHWSSHPYYGRGLHIAGANPDTCPLCAGNARGLEWAAHDPVAHRYPGKPTSPWYDEAILDMTDEQVAQELDIDYEGSLTARVYGEFSEGAHVVDDIAYTEHVPLEFGIDYGWGGSATWINVYQRIPGADGREELRQLGEVKAMHSTPEQVVAQLVEVLADLGVDLLELEPRLMRLWRCVGDPAGDAPLATGGSLADEYRKVGLNPQPCKIRGPNSIGMTIMAGKRVLLGRTVRLMLSRRGCPETIKAFTQNRWPTDRTGAIKKDATEPLNDVWNDGMRAYAYFAADTYPTLSAEGTSADASSGVEESNIPGAGSSSGSDGLSGDMPL